MNMTFILDYFIRIVSAVCRWMCEAAGVVRSGSSMTLVLFRQSGGGTDLSVCYQSSPPHHPPLHSNRCYMQIKRKRERKQTAEHEVIANDKAREVFDMQGAWSAICVGTWAHPKQKEIFPERSQPRRGPGTEARSTLGNGDLQLHEPVEAQTSPL